MLYHLYNMLYTIYWISTSSFCELRHYSTLWYVIWTMPGFNFGTTFKICQDDFYDSSPDPDCFGDYEGSADESEESPSKCSRLEKYDWVSLNDFFDTIGGLTQQYPAYLQLWHGKQKSILTKGNFYYRFKVFGCAGYEKCSDKVHNFILLFTIQILIFCFDDSKTYSWSWNFMMKATIRAVLEPHRS